MKNSLKHSLAASLVSALVISCAAPSFAVEPCKMVAKINGSMAIPQRLNFEWVNIHKDGEQEVIKRKTIAK
jgi:hypothetical protein